MLKINEKTSMVWGMVMMVVMAGFTQLDLQRGMVDAEAFLQGLIGDVDESVMSVHRISDDVRGQRDFLGTQRPDMHVMDGRDAR